MGPEVCVGLWEVLAFNLFLSVNVKQGRAPTVDESMVGVHAARGTWLFLLKGPG